MKLIDPEHPFFKPLWIRIVTAGVPTAWSIVEFASGQVTWGFIFLAAGIYAGLTFILHARNQR